MLKLFDPLPQLILSSIPPSSTPGCKGRPREKKEATRHSARQVARPSSVPVSKRVQGCLLKEMSIIEAEEALDDLAIAAFVCTFDQPLPLHIIARLHSLTRLDDKATILVDLAGQEGIAAAPA
ncbi:hypothetical protein E2562_017085 [Oryza meyeriana var. granulata]|uniref:Uncharacterized protein n=1 Tax=Oryza meyeriana var. granulata TaxID=110450 RepID=A0A6G1F8S9_9ORYZ|nr:hypothetical protein E2562_017085 [Oryza meyeriana var. granulata]